MGAAARPASWLGTGGLERPVAVRFSPDGRALYVVDFGVMTTAGGTTTPRPGTGVHRQPPFEARVREGQVELRPRS